MAKCLGIVLRSSTAPTAMPISAALRRREPLRQPCASMSASSRLVRSLNCCQICRFWRWERFEMAKDKQKRDEADETPTPSGRMSRKEFEKELARLQIELTRLQAWVKAEGARIVVVFEGRDTAGKGGVISRITARTSPRVYRHVALPAPSDREKTQVYPQRYIMHFPAAGEIILFDRSWYNRAGVERVMGFCTEEEAERFLLVTPAIEREMVVQNGI